MKTSETKIDKARKVIATFCGWTNFKYVESFDEFFLVGDEPRKGETRFVPEYERYSDEIVQAEQELEGKFKRGYVFNLMQILDIGSRTNLDDLFSLATASSERRVEAFVKTVDGEAYEEIYGDID